MDILGIGNALLDIFWFPDEEAALALGIHPNHAIHVSPGRLDELLLAIPNPILVSGGSASNSLKAASALGADTTFIGCTGTEDRECDRWGSHFAAELSSFGVHCCLESRFLPTGRCLVIYMPGRLKSIACAPSAAPELSVEQISGSLIGGAKIVLLDGQTLRNEEVAGKVIALCKERDIPLALDAGSVDVVQHYADTMGEILTRQNAIVFLNDDEALALAIALGKSAAADTDFQEPDQYIDRIFSSYCSDKKPFPCIVQKRGPRGARAWQAGRRIDAPTESADPILDDTGAGDTFNGAFLAAWLKRLPLAGCLAFANAAARTTLFAPGTRLDRNRFAAMKIELEAVAASANDTSSGTAED